MCWGHGLAMALFGCIFQELPATWADRLSQHTYQSTILCLPQVNPQGQSKVIGDKIFPQKLSNPMLPPWVPIRTCHAQLQCNHWKSLGKAQPACPTAPSQPKSCSDSPIQCHPWQLCCINITCSSLWAWEFNSDAYNSTIYSLSSTAPTGYAWLRFW